MLKSGYIALGVVRKVLKRDCWPYDLKQGSYFKSQPSKPRVTLEILTSNAERNLKAGASKQAATVIPYDKRCA